MKEQLSKNVRDKYLEDLERLKNLPPIDTMRQAVEHAFAILKAIHKKYAGTTEPLPAAVQAMANACMVACIWLDMFGGRKMEWERMLADLISVMLSSELDFVMVRDHKTSRTYGTIAKWFTPGTRAAAACYMDFPRPASVKTFLVPAHGTAGSVDIPSSLRTFGLNFLPPGCTLPTVNLMRKFFHKALLSLTKEEEGLKKV